MFSGRFTMNPTCPVCGHRFEREQGFFQGAMYVSWVLGVTYLAVLAILVQLPPRASDRNRLGRGVRSDDPHDLRSHHLPVLAGHLGACERRHQAMTVFAVVLLVGLGLVGLAMIPLGLPGLWVMVGGTLAYGWLTDFRTVGVATIAIVLGLAFLGEIIENWIGFRYAKRYGGSTRSGWGALIGGLVGAVIGVPVAVIGSVIGAFIGSFVGAALFEYSYSRHTGVATRAGWGAVVGRAAGAAVKIALGLIIAVVGLFAALS